MAEQRDSAAVERGREAQRGRAAADAADRTFRDVLWEAERRDQAIDDQRDGTGEPGGGRDLAGVEQEWRDAREHGRKDRAVLREEWGRGTPGAGGGAG
ncbi:hypothetical protein AB0I81_50770 [Nonomuraea sp. NPDC050404]|uniref:hypothetical protein n=1 Tax=Nonomuraea sp. NPDC050404 TaxID=3155783 RepID=UPI0033EAA513